MPHSRNAHRHPHRHHGAAHEAVKHAGLEGLLAGIPAALLFAGRSSVHTQAGRALNSLLDKSEKAANDALGHVEGKLKISAPVVVAAVVVVSALLHGAWRGAKKGEERSFARAEEERRARDAELAPAR